MNSRGDAIVTFQNGPGGFVRSRARPAGDGESWGLSQAVSTAAPTSQELPVALDDAGNANAIWIMNPPTGDYNAVKARGRPAGTDFAAATWTSQPEEELTTDDDDPFQTQLASNGRGDMLAAVRMGYGIDVYTATAGGEFTNGTLIGPGGSEVDAALDPAGNALVAWRLPGSPDSVQASHRAGPSGTFGTPAPVSPSGESGDAPRLAMDGEGNGVALWHNCNPDFSCTNFSASGHGMRMAGFDAAPPRLSNVSVPANGTTGLPNAFSASVFDVWGPVTTSWTFGDGGTAGGTSPSHTYAAAGSFPVGVTASDAVGNSASGGGTINVTDPFVPDQTGERPTLQVDVNADPVQGTVLVSVPLGPGGRARPIPGAEAAQATPRPPRGYAPFVRLEEAALVPVGSIFETTSGKVELTTETAIPGTFQSGVFSKGQFRTAQNRSGLTTLTMRGQRIGPCPRNLSRRSARTSQRRRIRRLSGSARGRFRTRGRRSSATVRGTRWVMEDSCRGTLTRVQEGSVTVRDFSRRRNVTVRAGRRYLARPR